MDCAELRSNSCVEDLVTDILNRKQASRPALDVKCSICQIQKVHQPFDWMQPPNRNQTSSSRTGTGFLLANVALPPEAGLTCILTAYHVISRGANLTVSFRAHSSESYPAELIGGNVDMDVAVIAIATDNVKSTLKPLTAGKSDRLKKEQGVSAYGFALGKPDLQTVKGSLSSRKDSPSRLQTDASVNPGNSGGPLFSDTDNRVIGLVHSGERNANGISYAAPIDEIVITCGKILETWSGLATKRPVHIRTPHLGFSFTKLDETLAKHKRCTGAIVTAVHPAVLYPQNLESALANLRKNGKLAHWEAPLAAAYSKVSSPPPVHNFAFWTKLLHAFTAHSVKEISAKEFTSVHEALRNDCIRVGDVLTGVDWDSGGVDAIDIQCTSDFSDIWADRIAFSSQLDRLQVGHSVLLQYRRDGEDRQVKHTLYKPLNAFRMCHPDADSVEYMVIGGVFVMTLTLNHVLALQRDDLLSLVNRPDSHHESLLIVTHILTCSPFSRTDGRLVVGDVLVGTQFRQRNVRVCTLYDLNTAWNEWLASNECITLETRRGTLTTATPEEVSECQRTILELEKRGSDYTDGLHNCDAALPLKQPILTSHHKDPRTVKTVDGLKAIRTPSSVSLDESYEGESSASVSEADDSGAKRQRFRGQKGNEESEGSTDSESSEQTKKLHEIRNALGD